MLCLCTRVPIFSRTAVSDVSEHSELDLDVAIMETEADKQTPDGFTAAYAIYSVGENRSGNVDEAVFV